MATRSSLMEFQIPRIVHEGGREARVSSRSSRSTVASATRSATRCAACALVARGRSRHVGRGVAHEFTTLPGVREDVTDILLNLKNLICRLHGEAPEIEVRLQKRGPGLVTAADIQLPADLEILNPDLEIAPSPTRASSS